MKNKVIKLLMLATLIVGGLNGVFSSCAHASDPFCDKLEAGSAAYEAAGCAEDAQLTNVVQNILMSVIGIAGLVAVIFIVIGGVNYMTSAGDANKVKKAKDTILYAVIGLAICALAFAIVNWTIGTINSGTGSTKLLNDNIAFLVK